MSGINFLGSYSGIDSSTVDQIIEAEAAKKVLITNKIEKMTKEKNTWNDINTRLDNLFKKLEALQKKEAFTSTKVSHGDEDKFVITAGADAIPAEYRIHVTQLASSSRLTGGKVAALNELEENKMTTALGISGSFNITNHEGKQTEIEIKETDSMKSILSKINSKTEESGIRATVIDDRLVLTDSVMGERNFSIEEVGTGNVVSSLGLNTSTLETGQSAIFKLNDLEITRNTNHINDVVEGMTFELKDIHTGDTSTLVKIETDTEKTVKAVKDLVDQYNSTMSFIKDQLDVGDPSAKDNKTGALVGDSLLMRIQSGLRNLLTSPVEESKGSKVESAKDLGISVDRYGVASFDEAEFKKALEANPVDVRNFFYKQETMQVEEENEQGEMIVSSKFVRTGLTENIRSFIDSFISKTTGVIKTKAETYDKMIKDANERVEAFNERLEAKRVRLIKQFTALDQAMMQADSQMSFMFSQLGMTNPNQQ